MAREKPFNRFGKINDPVSLSVRLDRTTIHKIDGVAKREYALRASAARLLILRGLKATRPRPRAYCGRG